VGFGFEKSDEGGGEVEALFHFLVGVGSYLNRYDEGCFVSNVNSIRYFAKRPLFGKPRKFNLSCMLLVSWDKRYCSAERTFGYCPVRELF
jgi:hypothetical protein